MKITNAMAQKGLPNPNCSRLCFAQRVRGAISQVLAWVVEQLSELKRTAAEILEGKNF